MENNKKQIVAPGKEESISLKENKVLAANETNKKKSNQISLKKLDLGTNPINISTSNTFINYHTILNYIKTRIKTIIIIISIIIVFIILIILKDILFNKSDEEKTEVKDLNVPENKVVSSAADKSSVDNQNLRPTNSSLSSSASASTSASRSKQ